MLTAHETKTLLFHSCSNFSLASVAIFRTYFLALLILKNMATMEQSLADIQLDDIDEDLLQLLDTVENYVLNVDHEEEEEEEEFAQIDASNYLNGNTVSVLIIFLVKFGHFQSNLN